MRDQDESSPLVVIASNRGPFKFEQRPDGSISVKRGSGGLVTALGALAEQHEVLWVASAMDDGDRQWAEEHRDEVVEVEGVYLRLVTPDPDRYEMFYQQIANPLLVHPAPALGLAALSDHHQGNRTPDRGLRR